MDYRALQFVLKLRRSQYFLRMVGNTAISVHFVLVNNLVPPLNKKAIFLGNDFRGIRYSFVLLQCVHCLLLRYSK